MTVAAVVAAAMTVAAVAVMGVVVAMAAAGSATGTARSCSSTPASRMVDRTHRELTDEDVARIAGVYHVWRQEAASIEEAGGGYADVPGFCRSAPLHEVRRHGHVLTPGRYVGAEPREDDGEPFEAKMTRLVAELRAQQVEGARLDAAIAENLKRLGFGRRDDTG